MYDTSTLKPNPLAQALRKSGKTNAVLIDGYVASIDDDRIELMLDLASSETYFIRKSDVVGAMPGENDSAPTSFLLAPDAEVEMRATIRLDEMQKTEGGGSCSCQSEPDAATFAMRQANQADDDRTTRCLNNLVDCRSGCTGRWALLCRRLCYQRFRRCDTPIFSPS
jgi:hypothetical protein